MRRRSFRFSTADGLLAILVIAMVCASVRLESVIEGARLDSKVLADEQRLIDPPSQRGAWLRQAKPLRGARHFRMFANRRTSLWCFEEHKEICELASFPAGEHILLVDLADYVDGRPTSLLVIRYTDGEEMQRIHWPFPDGLKSRGTISTSSLIGCVDKDDEAELCIQECGTRDLRFVLKIKGWRF